MHWAALVRQGRDAAGKGRHTEADAFFAQAAALSPDDLQRFLDVEWWVVGLYPEDLRAAYAPESDPDPSRPVAGPPAVTGGDPAKLAWLRARWDQQRYEFPRRSWAGTTSTGSIIVPHMR